jgi:hypothetical protein
MCGLASKYQQREVNEHPIACTQGDLPRFPQLEHQYSCLARFLQEWGQKISGAVVAKI